MPEPHPTPIHPSTPPDTTSSAYRKRLKHHLATTRPPPSTRSPTSSSSLAHTNEAGPSSRSDAGSSSTSSTSVGSHTPFRLAEKRYKQNFPPPFDAVREALDLALLDESREEEVKRGVWRGSVREGHIRELELLDVDLDLDLPSQSESDSGTSTSRRKKGKKRKAYVVDDMPGLIILPSFLTPPEQRDLVRLCLAEAAKSPNETNLDTHYLVPEEGLWAATQRRPGELIQPRAPREGKGKGESGERVMGGAEDKRQPSPANDPASASEPPRRRQLITNPPASPSSLPSLLAPKPPAAPSTNLRPAPPLQLLPKLRWANIGHTYHWSSKSYDLSRPSPPIPPPIADICKRVVRSIPWSEVYSAEDAEPEGRAPGWPGWKEDYTPDGGIINFYQLSSTLMGHIDHSELDSTRPLVSLSLGHACVFLVGRSRDEEPRKVLLRSGDGLVMVGREGRRGVHGVPRVLEGTLPGYLWDELEDDEDGVDLIAGDEDAAEGEEEEEQRKERRERERERWEEWRPFAEYLADKRVNVNVRQVFPPGMELPVHCPVAP